MFTDFINDLTICGDEAAEVFPRIIKVHEQPDSSFLATLRALLPKRMDAGDVFRFGLIRHHLDAEFHAKNSRNKIQILLHPAATAENGLYVVSLESGDKGVLDTVRLKTSGIYPSFRYLPEVSYYLSQKSSQKLAFVSKEDRTAIVVCEAVSISDWHYIQTVIPALLPWYFKDPRTEDETAILHSLEKTSSRDYTAIMERISMSLDLRAIKIRKMLSGLSQNYKQGRITDAERKIAAIEIKIAAMNQEMSRLITDKNESKIMLCGLYNMDDPHSTEIMDFFLTNKALHIVSADKGTVEYIVTGYLNSYDQHMFESCIRNVNSFFYTDYPNAKITEEELVKLLKAVFSPAPQCKLRVYSAFKLELGGSISPEMDYIFPDWLNTFIPNPHINNSGCLGGNLQFVNEYMANQDYIMAISQTLSANRNINFHDIAVIPHLVEKLRTEDPICIEMRNGDIVRPSEAVKLLDKQ